MRWNVKLQSNDYLRQRFIARTVPQAAAIGLTIPDRELKWNPQTRHYDHGEINWAEFYEVINGNGPCIKLRLKQRRDAHENGAWVREAAAAHAKKNSNRS